MRIRDLLAAESIELNGSATDKKDVLNKMVDLMAKSGKSITLRPIAQAFLREKKKEQQELVKELLFHIVSRMQSMHRDLQQWS